MEPFYAALYERLSDVHAELERCLDGAPPEALDWSPGPEMNSLAVLAAHVAGAERYWIGDVVGGEPSNRVREREFETAGQTAAALKERLAQSLAHSRSVLERLTHADLGREVYSSRHQSAYSLAYALLHALDHSAEHMGHMQMVRQLWEQRNPAP
ncbi:MAG TPA: DinB family protein [Caldilineaceae bacterium]|nr:DinB family protein [Caldilineaceae bacterium]